MNNVNIGNRPMKLYVLAHGYVAVVWTLVDIEFFGGMVIPLAFGSEVAVSGAVERMQRANPENRVVFSGGIQEYKKDLAATVYSYSRYA